MLDLFLPVQGPHMFLTGSISLKLPLLWLSVYLSSSPIQTQSEGRFQVGAILPLPTVSCMKWVYSLCNAELTLESNYIDHWWTNSELLLL